MFIIPFGMIGAVIGHMIVGIPITSLSSLGLIALAGVVVNDAILMVDHVNKRTEAGYSASDAAVEAGAVRFRPILLTSLTTFFGLTPVLLETSMAAQMVVPMAVSLSFGILFSTVITLIFLPCLFNILGERGTTFGKFIAFWTNQPLPTALPDPANQPVGQQP
jgi:multidrug efflux pump subunit AcrB